MSLLCLALWPSKQMLLSSSDTIPAQKIYWVNGVWSFFTAVNLPWSPAAQIGKLHSLHLNFFYLFFKCCRWFCFFNNIAALCLDDRRQPFRHLSKPGSSCVLRCQPVLSVVRFLTCSLYSREVAPNASLYVLSRNVGRVPAVSEQFSTTEAAPQKTKKSSQLLRWCTFCIHQLQNSIKKLSMMLFCKSSH